MNPRAFLAAYYPDALRSEERTGVPALFSLAQSALETGWSEAKPGNAMFGVKAGAGWHGKKQLLTTHEVFPDRAHGYLFPQVIAIAPRADGKFDYTVKDWFRAYDSPAASFDDHAAMLRGNARYARCFETADPREFARRCAAGGYATDPGYAVKLIGVIDLLEPLLPASPAPAPRAPSPPPPAKRGLLAAILDFLAALFGKRPA